MIDRGQGLNNALEDAGHYVRAMKDVYSGRNELTSAISTYNDDVYQRGKQAIDESREQTYACHHWNKLKDSSIGQKGFRK
jgi:2-polyprenyl-6-methoxyphenol hydroxylase-like FAD-dependent oxidoreductase